MKKICFLLFLFIFGSFFIFAEDSEAENYLFFLPDSGGKFVNEEQESIHLDNLAQQIKEKNLGEGQIHVYGYSADFNNEIDDFNLSARRAAFVIGELQKRGIPAHLFAEPKAYGSVNLWGDNTEENQRSPNRRVRIIIEGQILAPELAETIEPEIIETEIIETEIIETETIEQEIETITEPRIIQEENSEETSSGFPWWILFAAGGLVLLALIILLLAKKKKKSPEKTEAASPSAEVLIPVIVPLAASKIDVDLDEEIRYCAYMLSSHRNFTEGDVYWDWVIAKNEICARYEAKGYETKIAEDGHWHAFKTA